MAVRIELKRSNVPGKIPSTSQLQLGEVALNTYDGAAYFKKNVNGTETIVQFATTTGTGSGTVTSASHADYSDTSGYATNAGSAATATSASYSFFASNALSSSYAVTASFANNAPNAISASYAQTASYSDNFNIGNNLTVVGTITAQKLVVQVITSSTEFVTGSTRFGSQLTDTHQFTGSVSITGSLSVNGIDFIQTSASFDGRINGISGSFVTSASFNSFTASTNDSLADIKNATASLYNATASIYNATASLYAFTASILNHSSSVSASVDALNTFSASILNYTASNNANIAALNAATASLYNATASIYATTQSLSASIGSLSSSFLSVSASNSTRILALEQFSSSLDATFATDADLNALSSSFIAFTSSINSYTASNNNNIAALYAATASLNNFSASILNYTSSTNNSIADIRVATASLYAFSASINSYTASNNATITQLNNFSASILNYTSSTNATITQIQNATASLYNATASIYGSTSSLHNFSASILNYTASQNNLNGTFATTGSNVFRGNQTISGSLTVSGSTNINGTTNITGSVNVSGSTGNVFTVNVDTIVFTGSFLQSGSANINGSLTVTDTITAQKLVVQTISSSVIYSSGSNVFGNDLSNTQIFTGSVSITGSLAINGRNYLTDSSSFSTRVFNLEETSASLLAATASLYNATASIYGATASLHNFSASILNYTSSTNATIAQLQNATASLYNATASLYNFSASVNAFTASQAVLNGTYATTGSNIFRGNQTVTGSLFTSGSNTLVGSTTLTGSLNVTGSTTQTGNNTLIGNTVLSGSLIVSGTQGQPISTIGFFGDVDVTGTIGLLPVNANIDTTLSGSYIYVSGSTQDLYFAQNSKGYVNTTRLRWLEGNLYTGLLNGGLITAATGSTTYQISSGSGIIVNLNASLNDNPYPTIQYLNWGNLTGSISAFTSSFQQVFVGIDSTNNIFAQGTPFNNGQFDTVINIGGVFFQNGSTINAVKTQPSVAYGFEQAQNIFNRAFGPLKLSGYTLAPSGSSTLSLVVGSGTAYAPGSNYTVDPNKPSYTVDNGTSISKIFRYHQSGSTWVYDTNAGAGYTTINPGQYSNNGTLTTVQPNDWSIQRVFWFPNSVAKAIIVYYGNASYSTEAEAIANINVESFVEAPNTSANAVYLGAIVIRGNGVLTVPADFTILPGGLFRQVGGSGGGGSVVTQTLSGLSDVSISGQTSGQALVYDSTAAKWENKSFISASISGNASTSATASYAATASFVQNAQTASFVQNAVSASFATSASAATIAATASYADNFSVSGSLTVGGTITAQRLVVQFVTSSVELITGSLTVSGSLNALGGVTGSLLGTAATASFVQLAQSASYWSGSIVNALSASFADNANNAINAQTASYVVLAQSASYWSGSIQNAVSAAFAELARSASFATTASFALNAGSGGGGGLSALYIQDEGITQGTASYIDFTGAGVTATVSNGTASVTIPGGGGGTGGSAQTFTQSLSANTWSFAHSVNSRTPIVEVYDSSYNVIIPTAIYNPGPFATNIYFDVSQSGYAIISTGGVLSVTGSNAVLNQNVAATTWSFNHDLHTTYPVFTIYDSNDDVIIPQRIHAVDTGSAEIYFSTPRTGKAIASVGGNVNFASQSISTVSASFAATASSADDFFVRGTITAQTLLVQVITSSQDFVTGSTKFGTILSNTHQFTGSVLVTGSLNVNGSDVILTNQTSSMSVLSSSYAATASFALNVPQTASFALSASNAVTASYIATASYALTASYATNAGAGAGFPYSGSAVITGSLLVSQSFVDFSQASYVSGSFTGSLFGTASWATNAISASYAAVAGNSPGFTVNFTQSSAAATWSFVHNLNTRNPIVQVYDTTFKQIIPNEIVATDSATVEVRFDYNQAGYAVASNGGGLYITGSTSRISQAVAATTWSFNHKLNTKYPAFEVFDSNDNVIIPAGIKAVDTDNAEIYFATPTTGIAIAEFSGINGLQDNAVSASYALYAVTASYAATATSASFASTASYLNPITSGYVVLTQVSQSLNFVDDAAAAAGGVPLGGLYRNGNFIMIRLT